MEWSTQQSWQPGQPAQPAQPWAGAGAQPAAQPAQPQAAAAQLPAAGWYADPLGGGLRYWDGAAWTVHTAPAPGARGERPARSGPSALDWTLSVLLALVPLAGLIWGIYLIRRGDGSGVAGTLAIALSVLVAAAAAAVVIFVEPF